MGKAGKIRKKRSRVLDLLFVPIPPCTKTRDGIHRDQPDAHKCKACHHHHCQACSICARCRRYGDQRCYSVGAKIVPIPDRDVW